MNQEVMRYRRQRAAAALHVAEQCCSTYHCNDTVNRTYFACYYAVSALLSAHGLEAKGHDETVALFLKDFVDSGMITESSGSSFRDLSRRRLEIDYEDFKDASAEEAQTWLAVARGLMGEIDEIMSGGIQNDMQ